MDLVFGSSGVAIADQERMDVISSELGLDRLARGGVSPPTESENKKISTTNEKAHL